MNALRFPFLTVRTLGRAWMGDWAETPNLTAATGFNLFVALTSSDGYKTLLSHLGPDKKASFKALAC
jgi:hypothetical protein